MRIAVLGKGELAIKVAEYFFGNELYIVPVMPEPSWCPSLYTWGEENAILIKSGDYRDLPSNLDLVISVFYEKIIKQDFLDRQNKVINIHNSPLPKYRGVRPINWAFRNGEHQHGVTIHQVTAGIDDGNIYGQILYPIYPDIESVKDAYSRALQYAWSLFLDVIPRIDSITPYSQDHTQATYYSFNEINKLCYLPEHLENPNNT